MTSMDQNAPTSLPLRANSPSAVSWQTRTKAFLARIMAGRELTQEELQRLIQARAEHEAARRREDHLLALEARRF